jgi:hypothetical protein
MEITTFSSAMDQPGKDEASGFELEKEIESRAQSVLGHFGIVVI